MSRQLNELNIWLNGILIGAWRRKLGKEEFQYNEAWLKNKQGRPISLSMPFTPGNQIFRGDMVKYYFDNLLPDSNDIRERLATKFGAKGISPFELLIELGRDCVGAIQLLPPNKYPQGINEINYQPLDESQIAAVLRNTVTSSVLGETGNESDLRFSLAGAQEKSAFLWHNNQWCLPKKSTPTTHIFKLPLGLVGDMKANMENSVENEWLCSKILAAYGLPVAHCDIAQFEDQKVLIVKRFDRKLSSDKKWIIRLPQEDMCQAKGISPLFKYQLDGGMGISDCMEILQNSHQAQKDKQIFFKSQLIFWILFATDGHAKNFSIHHLKNNNYQLTPLYDILSALPVIGNKHNQIPLQKVKLAMAIRSKTNHYNINMIQRRHFVNQAIHVGFTIDEAETMINQITNKTEDVINTVGKKLPDSFPKKLANTIFSGMIKQSKKLAN